MVNIYDTANELSNQLKETQEYQGLKKAFDSLKAQKTLLKLLRSSNKCKQMLNKSK